MLKIRKFILLFELSELSRVWKMPNTRKIWNISATTGRRVRVKMLVDNEMIFLPIKLFQTGQPHQSISVTLSEFVLIPTNDMAKASGYENWEVSNGRRRLIITCKESNGTQNTIQFEIKKFKSGEWTTHGSITLTRDEFNIFITHMSRIIGTVVSTVMNRIAHTPTSWHG